MHSMGQFMGILLCQSMLKRVTRVLKSVKNHYMPALLAQTAVKQTAPWPPQANHACKHAKNAYKHVKSVLRNAKSTLKNAVTVHAFKHAKIALKPASNAYVHVKIV